MTDPSTPDTGDPVSKGDDLTGIDVDRDLTSISDPDLSSILAALEDGGLRRQDHDGKGRWHCPNCHAPMRVSEAPDGSPVLSCVRRCPQLAILARIGFTDGARAARRQAAIDAELDRRYAHAAIEVQFLTWLRERGSSTP